jgi:hypothetical protein
MTINVIGIFDVHWNSRTASKEKYYFITKSRKQTKKKIKQGKRRLGLWRNGRYSWINSFKDSHLPLMLINYLFAFFPSHHLPCEI